MTPTLPDLLPIPPFTRPARGEVTLPGSKSITNRALLLAALCDTPVTLTGALFSEDTQLMTEALRKLGFTVEADERALTLRVADQANGFAAGEEPVEIFVGLAGTAARFLTALCAAVPRGVYRIDGVTGKTTVVVSDRVQPNGLAFSPDETVLYVADTGATHVDGLSPTIWSYALDGQTVPAGSLFATCPEGFYDGFRCDIHGNIWTSAGRSVFCYSPDGTHLGTIPIGEIVANVCFGGPRRNRLYICGQTSLYAIYLNTRAAV